MFYKHISLFKLIFIIFCISLMVNLAIDKHLVILSGEFPFSFQHTSHFKNLIANYLFNTHGVFSLLNCNNCPQFYGLTPWNSAWMFALVSLGNLLKINHFIYYIFITATIQIISLYVFTRLLLKQFSWPIFLFGAFIFVFFPHKIYLVPSYTMDGVIYGLFLGFIALFIYLLVHLDKLSMSKVITISLCVGILSSSFLNFALSHLPIFFYSFLLTCLIFVPRLIKYIKKSFIIFSIIGIVSVSVNYPFVLSYIQSTENSHYLTSYNRLSLQDSLTGGLILAGVNPLKSVFFMIIVFSLLLISEIRTKIKVVLIVSYLCIAFILTGGEIGSFSLYGLAFNHLPLLNHLRSLYRLLFFQLVIIYISIYWGLLTLSKKRGLPSKLIFWFVTIFCLYFVTGYIYRNVDLFHTGAVPEEYFQVDKYLSNNFDKKIYFPTYGAYERETLSGNYTWLPDFNVRNRSLYSNPFTNLFYLPRMVFTDGYQLNSPEEGQLRSLISYKDSPKDSIAFLESMGIEYLIVDKNYLWSKNFSDFKLDEISKYAKLDKKFGNIEIYRVENKQKDCKSAYGDYEVGYCYILNNPKYLINKSKKDYALDMLLLSEKSYVIKKSEKVKLEPLIVNSYTLEKVIEEKLLRPPYTIYQADNVVKDIYVKSIPKGNYKLFMPVLKLSEEDKLFNDTQMIVKINNKQVKKISPYSTDHGFIWEEVSINALEDSTLSIDSDGQGLIVFGNPLLFASNELTVLTKRIESYMDIQVINTQ